MATAALNQSADVAGAEAFLQVLRELSGPRTEDSAVGLPTPPLDEVFALPAARVIEARGGTVLAKSPGRLRLDASGSRVARVLAGAVTIAAPRAICPVPLHQLGSILPGG